MEGATPATFEWHSKLHISEKNNIVNVAQLFQCNQAMEEVQCSVCNDETYIANIEWQIGYAKRQQHQQVGMWCSKN